MKMLEDGEDPFVPAPRWRPEKKKSELEDLKSLVRSFLEEIKHVPFRAVDCDQDTVKHLKARLQQASGSSLKRKAKRRRKCDS